MNFRKLSLIVLLLAVVIAPRLPGLDSFVTLDEPFWLSVGGNFYYALGQRELQNTVYEYHPAVTTMWFVTDAFLVYFPEYRGLGQGYIDNDKEHFDPFLLEHGKSPMHLLYLSRLFQLAVIVLFALVIFILLARLLDEEKAFLVTAFISSAPYFLGHSRVLSHEAMVAFFVLASIFGLMAYLEYERKWYYLLISAASASLAQLTKSSAMAMMPVIALMLAISIFENQKTQGFKPALMEHLKIFGLWFLELAIVYVILWPGMWVAPGKMLYEVYGNAFSYAFQGARLQVTHDLQPSTFSLDALGYSVRNFVTNILRKGTPIAWLGFILALASVLLRQDAPSRRIQKLMLYLFTTAVMFVLLFSIARGRNSPHYIMSAHVSLDAIAALGWVVWLGWLGKKWETAGRPGVRAGGVAALVVIQLASALMFYPYYYTYYNPLMPKPNVQGYGEGLELAAAYLAQKPDAENISVFAYNGRGPFSYFFPGRTIILNPLFLEVPGMPDMLERFPQSDYLVFYDGLKDRNEYAAKFVSALDGIEPETVINVQDGLQYIRIYRTADLTPAFYEAISK